MWTEILSGLVFAPAQKLAGMDNWRYVNVAKNYFLPINLNTLMSQTSVRVMSQTPDGQASFKNGRENTQNRDDAQ